jgi:four helix bundle protein
MDYSEWEARIPERFRRDPLWRMRVYRLASFVATESWDDAARLARCKVTVRVSAQLYKAIGSISADISEGYSRSGGRDRARFFEYALGSVRETRDWYLRALPVLGEERVFAVLDVLEEIIRMLLAIIPRERENDQRPRDEPS